MAKLSRDAVLYDQSNDSSIGYIRKVVTENAVPDLLKSRKEFDGFFIKKIEYLEGKFLFDSHLASYAAANYENFSDIKNDIFICIVFVPELHHINRDELPVEPTGEEYNKLIEKLLASRKGVFKSYDYAGEEPAYLSPVKVSFADTDGFTDPLFESPLAGGAARVGSGATGGAAGTGAGAVAAECAAVDSVNTTVGNANNGNKNISQTEPPTPRNATTEIIITKASADDFMVQDSKLTVMSTDGEEYTISFNSALPINNDDLRPSEGTGDEVIYGLSGLRGTGPEVPGALENMLAKTLDNAFNIVFEKAFTSEIISLVAESAPAVGAPATTNVLRTADCDFEKFNSNHINHGNGEYAIFVPKEFNSTLPVNVMLWFHGNGGVGGKDYTKAAKVIDEGPGLPSGENRVFIAPNLGSNPGGIGNVSNPSIKPEFLEDALNSLYSRLFPGDPNTGTPGAIPVIETIRGYGWSAGGSPLSQFFSNYIENFGLQKIKIIRYLDADYGNKDHFNFAKKLKETLEDATQGPPIGNFDQTWSSIVSFVVQTKGKPGTPLAKPLQYSWAYSDKGYPKKGNQERHKMVYPQGVPIYVLDVDHAQCGWQTADYIDNATEGSTTPSQISIDARIKLTQKIAGSSGNTPVLFVGNGLTVGEFTGGRDLQEKTKPEDPVNPSPHPANTGGSVPPPTPVQEPVKIPIEQIDASLKELIDAPHPTKDFDGTRYTRNNPIMVLKTARAFGLEVSDKLINILSISKYYSEAEGFLTGSEAKYFSSSLDLNPMAERPPTFSGLNKTDSKNDEGKAALNISKDILVPYLEGVAAIVYPPAAESPPPAAPPAPAPSAEKPSDQEVSDTTPDVSQPVQPQGGSNVCAQAAMVDTGGAVVAGGSPGGSVTLEYGGAAQFTPGQGVTGVEKIPSKKVWREIVATGGFGNIGPAPGKKKGNGYGRPFPAGDGTPDFPVYSRPYAADGLVPSKGEKAVKEGMTFQTPLNVVTAITQEYMRQDAAAAANAVGKELRALGCVFFFDSCGRTQPYNPSFKTWGNHNFGLGLDLSPSAAMCDPTQDIYVVTPGKIVMKGNKGRVYWRVYARSIGYSGIDSLIAGKSAEKSKSEWYHSDSMPGNQVPNITINAAYIRHKAGEAKLSRIQKKLIKDKDLSNIEFGASLGSLKDARLYFTEVTGPFVDLTSIFIKHGFLPIAAHDGQGANGFWRFRNREFADYNITETNLPQGLPLKAFAGNEWWHFEFLKNNVESDTAGMQIMRKFGTEANIYKHLSTSSLWINKALKQIIGPQIKAAKASGSPLSSSEKSNLKKESMPKAKAQAAEWAKKWVYGGGLAKMNRLKANVSSAGIAFTGQKIYGNWYK